MPNFTLEQLPDQSAIVLKLHAEYVATRDLAESNPLVYNLLETAPDPIYYVIDVDDTSFSLEDLIQAAATTTHSKMSTFSHPNVREVIVVSNNTAIRMALEGLDSEAFGFIKIHIADTLDDALAYIQSN